jgi:Prokaryotic diacylglycerol kinase
MNAQVNLDLHPAPTRPHVGKHSGGRGGLSDCPRSARHGNDRPSPITKTATLAGRVDEPGPLLLKTGTGARVQERLAFASEANHRCLICTPALVRAALLIPGSTGGGVLRWLRNPNPRGIEAVSGKVTKGTEGPHLAPRLRGRDCSRSSRDPVAVHECRDPLTCALGTLLLAVETIDTAIEKLCDVVQPLRDPKIEKIKDVAAGCHSRH